MATLGSHASSFMDQATLRAIMDLQLEDLEAMSSSAKGKQREGTSTDAQVAMQIYIEDLQAYEITLANQEAAKRMASANTDQQDIRSSFELRAREEQIANDRELARKMSTRVAKRRVVPSASSDNRKVRFAGPSADVRTSSPKVRASPTPEVQVASPARTRASQSKPEAPARSVVLNSKTACVACNENNQLVVQAPCRYKHRYCRSCIVKLFDLASRDESLFPPKCDGTEIPLDSVRPFLSLELLRVYETRAHEARSRNRTYCHNRWCTSFILENNIQGTTARCRECGAATCAACKAPAHKGDCPLDSDLQQLKLEACKQRWQKCYSCQRYVQLETGCNHITCRCGAEFCYACGLQWKSCDCEYWDERYLLSAEGRRTERTPVQSLPEQRSWFNGSLWQMPMWKPKRPASSMISRSHTDIPERASNRSAQRLGATGGAGHSPVQVADRCVVM